MSRSVVTMRADLDSRQEVEEVSPVLGESSGRRF